jgi:biotin transport system substrate-specific component
MLASPRFNRLPAAERGITIGDFLVPIRVGDRMSSRARHVALVIAGALFVFLTAQISIRLPGTPIPVTGQVFGVLLVGGALGFRRGFLAMLLYVAIGVIGYPAFAEHRGGIQVIAAFTDGRLVLGSSGGYLVGFIVAGALVGLLAELGWDRHILGSLAAMVIGDAAIYLIGVPWLMAALNLSLADGIAKGLVPFLLWDAVKIALAAGLFPAAWWVVGRRPGER